MSEPTGMEARIIHCLLEFNPADGYKQNDENPLEGDVLIVDEYSIINIILMNNLICSLVDNVCQVIKRDSLSAFCRLMSKYTVWLPISGYIDAQRKVKI